MLLLYVKRRSEDMDAQALGERGCIEAVAAGKSEKELIECEKPEQIITPEESRGPLRDLADRVVARGGAELMTDLVEFDNAKRDETERCLHALRPIGFAKQRREQIGAVVGIGEHGCRIYRPGLETV